MDQQLKTQADAALAKWTPLAANAEEAHPNAPIHVLLGEAIDVASMLSHYWEPQVDQKGLRIPGFAGVAAASNLSLELGTEIRELQLAAASAHAEYLVLVEGGGNAPFERADFVLGEIRASLEFLFDDGVQDDSDAQLDRLRQAFSSSGSQDAMALALEGYAALAELNRERLAQLEGFDVTLIEEARALAGALRAQSASQLTQATPDAQRQALALRNRLLTLLLERVKRVRRAAQYVFRNYTDVVRKFSSAYERRQRAQRRRAKDVAASEGAGAAAAGGGTTRTA